MAARALLGAQVRSRLRDIVQIAESGDIDHSAVAAAEPLRTGAT